jgi:hypothetical protein
MSLDEGEARNLLNATRSKLAERLRAPLIWHVAFAAVAGAEVAAQGLPTPWSTLATGAMTLALFGVIAWNKSQRGVWANGWRSRRTWWVTALLVGLFTVAIISSFWFYRHSGNAWLSIAIAAGTFAAVVGLSLLKERIYRDELERGL